MQTMLSVSADYYGIAISAIVMQNLADLLLNKLFLYMYFTLWYTQTSFLSLYLKLCDLSLD